MSKVIVLSPAEVQELIKQTVSVTVEMMIQEFRMNQEKELGKEILNVDEVCELLDLAKPTIYTMTSRGDIPYYKTGKRLHFKRSVIMEWFDKKRFKTNDELQEEAKAYVKRNKLRR